MSSSLPSIPLQNILVIGSGGREHALVWKLLQSPLVQSIHVAPGNAGTAQLSETANVKNVPSLKETMLDEIVNYAKENQISLVIPGPEVCLVAGIADMLQKAGIPCFGPSQRAAQLEGSKAFSKAFMLRHAIPTAACQVFSDYPAALAYIDTVPYDLVIKASGLAAGKGVVVPNSKSEAKEALRQMMVENIFGDAGKEVVIEEKLVGQELSVLAFSDGYTVAPLPAARDYKRVFDADAGPNTGGMGAYAPAAPPHLVHTVVTRVLQPAVRGLRREGAPFVGVLYAGLMLAPDVDSADGPDGVRVLEFNVRFGDPETQVLLPLLATDLVRICLACCHGYLDAIDVQCAPDRVACTVVAAAQGYPGAYKTGVPVTRLPTEHWAPSVVCFHAGTALDTTSSTHRKNVCTAGGRVLCLTATAATLADARARVYAHLPASTPATAAHEADSQVVWFDGMHFRRDIGASATLPALATTTYASAGVSIDQGDALVAAIQPWVKATRRPGADADLGGFGGLFDLAQAGFAHTDVLVAATDGVGTKLKLAFAMQAHGTIGIDLVAMNVNDIVVQGARPLFFLDYFACGRLDVAVAATVIQGIAQGCQEASCALIGGETAEMPSMYAVGEYDLAGFCVGAVAPANVLPRPASMGVGDCVLGLVASGVHSNGFALVRHVTQHLDLHGPCPFDPARSLGDVLLTPTRIYVDACLRVAVHVKGMAHITGGGLLENIPRILPDHLGVVLDANAWPRLPVFTFLQSVGKIASMEMLRTFNCGLGMVVVASPEKVEVIRSLVPEFLVVGKVCARASPTDPQVVVENF